MPPPPPRSASCVAQRHPLGRRAPPPALDRRRLAAAARPRPRQPAGAAMTFEWPLGLLALAVLPLLLAAARGSRAGARRATRCASATSACSPASSRRPARPGASCRRRCCAPRSPRSPSGSPARRSRSAPSSKQGTVVLALDRSGSMLAQDVDPDRITASRKAASSFVKNLPSGFAVGVVTFSDTADAVSAVRASDKAAAQRAIAAIQAGGGTAIGDALDSSLGLLGVTSATTTRLRQGPRDPPALRRLEHAGLDPSTATALAKRAGVRVYTIALGTPDGVARPRGARPGHRHHPRPARPRGAQGDRPRDRRRVVHRARPVHAEEGLQPHRHAGQLDQGTEGSHLRGRRRRRAPAARGGRLLLGTPEHHMTFADPYLLAALIVVPAGADRLRRARTARAARPCARRRTPRCGRTSCRAGPAGAATSRPPWCCWRSRCCVVGRRAAPGQPAERPEGDDRRPGGRHVQLDEGDRRLPEPHRRGAARPRAS